MQGYFPPQERCANCGNELKAQHTGRPGEYCGTACRQAAHRKRQRENHAPDTAMLDAELTLWTKNLESEVHRLAESLENPNARGEEPLTSLMRIQQRAEKLRPALVARARCRGVSWTRIGRLLNLNKDTVRRKYHDVDRIVRGIVRLRTTPTRPADEDSDPHRTPRPPPAPRTSLSSSRPPPTSSPPSSANSSGLPS